MATEEEIIIARNRGIADTFTDFLRQTATMSTGSIGLMRVVNLEEPLKPVHKYEESDTVNEAGNPNTMSGFLSNMQKIVFLSLHEGTNIIPNYTKIIRSDSTAAGTVNYHWGSKVNNLQFKETTGMLVSKEPGMQFFKIAMSESLEKFMLQNATYYDENGDILYAGLVRLVIGNWSTLLLDILRNKNFEIAQGKSPSFFDASSLSNFSTFLNRFLDNFFHPEIEAYGYVHGFNKNIDRGYKIEFDWEFAVQHIIYHKLDMTNFTNPL